MEHATVSDERGSGSLSSSFMASMAAGMLVSAFTFVLGFVLSLATDHDPAWILGAVTDSIGIILVVVVFVGLLLGLAATGPLHMAMRWWRPRSRGALFLAGAGAVIAGGFGAMTLDSEAMSGPLFFASLLVATGFVGAFFSAVIHHWNWTEPCAS